MTSSTHVLPGACVLLLIGTLFGCGPEDDASTLGDWTLKDSLQLTETLRVSETETFYFGTVTDLDVTSDGRIVVADRQASNLKVLRPDGALLDTLGGAGEGPGEFQMIGSLQVARGDSLFAYDIMHGRLSVFAPTSPYELERSISISQKNGRLGQLWILDDGFLGLQLASGPTVNPAEPRYAPLRRFGGGGAARDSVTRWRLQQMVVERYDGGGFTAKSLPFGRSTVTALGPDQRLYMGWTDALTIRAYTPRGRVDTAVAISADPPPVTPTEQEAALDDFDSDDLRATANEYMPDTKPAFTHLVVAEDGRLWVRRPPEGPDADTAPWWILDPDAKTIRKARLPADVDLAVVRNGKAYGTTTEMGAPAVVRYQIGPET